ncbi:MAG: glucoamylase family protein [Clostridiaceae bacterium]
MFYLSIILVLILIVAYLWLRRSILKDNDYLEDLPTITISGENLEAHAEEISGAYSNTVKQNSRRKMLKLLNESYKRIIGSFEYIDRDIRNNKEVISASEWLLDNLYLIEKEYKDVKHDSTIGFYRKLPVLSNSILKGYPRVYYIAVEIVKHTDGRLTGDLIKRFLDSYQQQTVLTSAELWAFPIMLRIALLQKISKICDGMMFIQKEKNKADLLGDDLVRNINNEKYIKDILEVLDKEKMLSSHFVERLIKILRDNGVDNLSLYSWIERKLEKQDSNIDKMIVIDHQRQASFQLGLGNSITGIREIGALPYSSVFEELSYVEKVLRQDPAGLYCRLDFDTRDYYRHKIEKYSKLMKMPESFISKQIVQCASEGKEDYERHIGYYLIDDGVECLKEKTNYKDRGLNSIVNHLRKFKVSYYIRIILIGSILLDALIILGSLANDGNPILYKYILAALVLFLPCSEIVNSILNYSVNQLSQRRYVPKLDLVEGVSEENRTIIVIPTIINNSKRTEELIENLETFYLSNEEENLYFALLGDLKDSDQEINEDDEKINAVALKKISELNKKYRKNKEDIFYYFNRTRKFNDKENKYLGWERKRGKLVEFVSLIRGAKNTSYNIISSDISPLLKAKYIITLDADTVLPIDTAKKLIGAMSHPLNRAIVDESGRVVRGYGLMQPRINISTISANKTIYSKLFSGETGIDTYTMAVSDVYQDLFGEGIFTGKGIFDIDVFHRVLGNAFPENAILSHDLIEGAYIRCALVSDIALIDGYPSSYAAASKRLHRWVRGDWQLLPWVTKKSPINKLSRWKMIDNLRRSLISPAVMLLLLFSFGVLPKGYNEWIGIAILAVMTPLLFDVSEAVVAPIKGFSLSGEILDGKTIIKQVFLIFVFLPYNAYLMLDAIIRSIYRVYFSKRNLLQWVTAADAEATSGKTLTSYIHSMFSGSLIGLLIGLVSYIYSLTAFMIMLPSVIIWFLSPVVAYFISKEIHIEKEELTIKEEKYLRRISRKTYAYFEDFISEETNYLAPDNFQEVPYIGVAPRTSPTNIGMGLTCNIVAYDLGYIDFKEFVNRLDTAVAAMEALERYKGHFYNWYDTSNRKPLFPRYISTVDSGNLVGYLWLLDETIVEYLNKPYINESFYYGLEDTIRLAQEELNIKYNVNNFYEVTLLKLQDVQVDIFRYHSILKEVWSRLIELEKEEKFKSEFNYWNNKLKTDVRKLISNLQSVFPWIQIVEDNLDYLITYREDFNSLASSCKICRVPRVSNELINKLKNEQSLPEIKNIKKEIINYLEKGREETKELIYSSENIKKRINVFCEEADFSMLFDKNRSLFSIGYDVEHDTLGNSYYDLLASEARIASFISIAKGEINPLHWFKLGRAITIMNSRKGLVSWSGTMFEYFMPLLIMRDYPDTLFHATYKGVVEGQIQYGKKRKIPWGISESAYYNFDPAKNYQYKAHGVPGIGLKRGLRDELVVSPYSTVLAMLMNLRDGIENLKVLKSLGTEGKYGFYEAIDYTKDRLPNGEDKAIIKNYMVHHQGMSLMALDNILNGNVLQDRFHKIPRVKATEVLLQERLPNRVVYSREVEIDTNEVPVQKDQIFVRTFNTAKTTMPEVALLSNGKYSVMLTNSGSGYSKKEDMALYRFRDDVTLNDNGMFFYIKDVKNDFYYSATYQPTKVEPEDYKAVFALDKVEFKRRDKDLITETSIAVSYEEDAEIREISLINRSGSEKIIEVTSYCEVTLAPFNADNSHPAFSNLFIKTEYDNNHNCILANRRPRSKKQSKPWMMQKLIVKGETIGAVQYETSRVNFIGRNRTLEKPEVIDDDVTLKNTTGAVLDPIISIRRRIKISADETVKLFFITAVGYSKDEMIAVAKKYNDEGSCNRIFSLAQTQSLVELKYLGIKYPQANLFTFMASKIIFMSPLYKHREKYIAEVTKPQRSLWAYGISGDLPIVLLKVNKISDKGLIKQLISAHEYWTFKGLKVDLVIIDMEDNSYHRKVEAIVRDIVASSHLRDKQNTPGGVFLNSTSNMPEDIINLLTAISRLVIDSEKGLLVTQIKYPPTNNEEGEILKGLNHQYKYEPYKIPLDTDKLLYYNEYGGFDENTGEYVIFLKDGKNTPAPWINVISNESFGFHVSESGSAYTWYKNSRENKITTWNNDWVRDLPSEILYLRDDLTGEVWNVSKKPIRHENEYIVRHGFGYSTFQHFHKGIYAEETMFVPRGESVKFIKLKLKNTGSEKRKVSLIYFAQLVLGVIPDETRTHVYTKYDEEGKFIFGENPYSEAFNNLFAYLKIVGGTNESFTGDRGEFIGREGNLQTPKMLKYKTLNNKTGAGIDPCLATSSTVEIAPNSEVELAVILGQCDDLEVARRITHKYSDINIVNNIFEECKKFWRDLLGTIKVKTPDKAMDLMVNGWLMYQDISCRLWSRTAFYQSGGAYGFRDQLQDVMSLSYLRPKITRDQIVYSCSRQFVEGDVQHWWHPVVDSGIRTRFSDDLLWLPFVACDYIKNTGDYSVLDEEAYYLEDEPLSEGEDERYTISRRSDKKGTVYEHCIKALERGLQFGSHNIPLMGCGDWNDGMSTVGNEGRGESVWLGWFIYSILNDFIDICHKKKDDEKVTRYSEMKEFIRENIEKNAYDGKWYRRAYFDDGTPMGSSENDECQIDSLAQTWGVISDGASKNRIEESMKSLESYLMKDDKNMILLFTPAFENSKLEPGYIKGYVAGVRENGGQYTHAATWVSLAFARMGDGFKAHKAFNMLNPISHTKSYLDCQTYKVEPYVICADVYNAAGFEGRGGWTWYTGSAGWMYRAGIDGILGLKLYKGLGFKVEPCIPPSWNNYEITYNINGAVYNIEVSRGEEKGYFINDTKVSEDFISWQEDGEYQIKVVI